MPTLAGFLAFIRGVMGIDPLYLPDDAPVIGYAFQVAMGIVNPALCGVCFPRFPGGPLATNAFTLAVYNLAGDNVITFAQDQAGRDYFDKTREKLGINKFSPGVVASTSDQATATSLLNPDFMRNLTMANLQNMRTPWGRQYLSYAQAYGPNVWGLS